MIFLYLYFRWLVSDRYYLGCTLKRRNKTDKKWKFLQDWRNCFLSIHRNCCMKSDAQESLVKSEAITTILTEWLLLLLLRPACSTHDWQVVWEERWERTLTLLSLPSSHHQLTLNTTHFSEPFQFVICKGKICFNVGNVMGSLFTHLPWHPCKTFCLKLKVQNFVKLNFESKIL